ncbi:cytochrome P450 [Micromonospora sp. FIMYZ51]|uniref:cytochrome P450 n=1 Tax=Micromonospora sp. FIMYZ51 TaxID=3051832 RepID=UPI00311F20F4
MDVAPVGVPPRFDVFDPHTLTDPYQAYRQAREAAPICRGGPGQWVVLRHADISRLLRDDRLGTEFPPEYQDLACGDSQIATLRSHIVMTRDGAVHNRLARLMGQAFSPTRDRSLIAGIDREVRGAVDRVLALGHFDALNDLAFPLVVEILCRALGVAPSDAVPWRARVLDLGRAFVPVIPAEERAGIDATIEALRDVVRPVVAARRTDPRDDLVSRLVAAQATEDWLSTDMVVDNVVFLWFAGFETTVNLVANGCAILAERDRLLTRLRAEPALVPGAVEEFARFEAPIQVTSRYVRAPVEVGGRTVRRGRIVHLVLGSGNRDPEQFADPDTVDPTRSPNQHLGFGGGPHYCLGAPLARLICRTLFAELTARTGLVPAAPAERAQRVIFRGYRRVPLVAEAV